MARKNDRVEKDSFSNFDDSLCLIALPKLSIEKVYGKLKANFSFQDEDYCLSVTDPEIKKKYGQMKSGNRTVIDEPVLLCLSLAEPFQKGDGCAYKLIAGIITRRDAGK